MNQDRKYAVRCVPSTQLLNLLRCQKVKQVWRTKSLEAQRLCSPLLIFYYSLSGCSYSPHEKPYRSCCPPFLIDSFEADRVVRVSYSLEKWLHNWTCYPSNRSKQFQETHTAYIAGTQYTRQSLYEKQHTWLHRQVNCLKPCLKPCVLSSTQTLPSRLCVGTIGRVSFLDLFGPIAGVINPIM